jgi:hypothetical protein
LTIKSKTSIEGVWMQTYSGRKFFPFAPRVEDVFIEDIAHSLSMMCRYNGHCTKFYSIAEHSLHVSRLIDGAGRLEGLLHDAAECYISDIPGPIKRALPDLVEIEDRIFEVVAKRFDLQSPLPLSIKRADLAVTAAEKRQIMMEMNEPWPFELPEPDQRTKIECWQPEIARENFLMEFERLSNLR